MKFALPSLLVTLSFLLPLAAQEDEDGEKRQPRGRLAWFIVTSLPDGLENPVRVMTGNKIEEVILSRRMSSGPVKIPADGIIRMVRPVAAPETPDGPAYETLAQVRIPDGMQKAAVILIAADEKQAPLVYTTKVQDLSEFTGGDFLFMNFTTANMMVRLGDKRLPLKPGASRIFRAPALDQPLNTPISYHYFHPTKQEWKMLSASTVVMQPTRREICIFNWDPRYQRVSTHGITFPVTN